MDEYRQTNIFDIIPDDVNNYVVRAYQPQSTDNYDDFVAKFEQPKTTDDCFTPPEVYDAVLQFCNNEFADIMQGKRVARPFYPGGDYQNYNYDNAVVVDNPPFNILSQIVRWYMQHNVPFLLFCPHLTSFNSLRVKGVCVVCCSATITYNNGAIVRQTLSLTWRWASG